MNTRIKALRNELALSQEDFANAINLSRNFVWMIEKGEREPSDRTISDICRIFHVNELWLRTGEGSMFQERTREVEIAEITAKYFKADDTDFGYQLARILNEVSDDEIEILYKVAEKWVDHITQARIVKQEKIAAQTREQEGPEREL